jgi:hypothetical protein
MFPWVVSFGLGRVENFFTIACFTPVSVPALFLGFQLDDG